MPHDELFLSLADKRVLMNRFDFKPGNDAIVHAEAGVPWSKALDAGNRTLAPMSDSIASDSRLSRRKAKTEELAQVHDGGCQSMQSDDHNQRVQHCLWGKACRGQIEA